VEKDFLRCPNCLRKLKDACGTCAKPLDPEWKICPYCESEIPGVTPPARRRRRSRTTSGSGGSTAVEEQAPAET
jgi:predicted amidophosphoribosyltransferase